MNNICHKIMLTGECRIYFKDQRRFSSRIIICQQVPFLYEYHCILLRKQISEKKSELKKKENLYYAVRTDR